MTTIDQYLTNIVLSPSYTLENLISGKDARVLRSLNTAAQSPAFITENQSKLLLKILKENSKKFNFLGEQFLADLENPAWTRIFRPVDKTKKMYIGKNAEDDLVIVIEFAFSSHLRKILANLGKKTEGAIVAVRSRIHHCDLTEKNIVTLVEAMKAEGFDISDDLKNHYETIKSWSEDEVKNQFLLTTITHQNFQKHITTDLGVDTAIDENIIVDRSNRYQYFPENPVKNPENLVEKIAYRKSSKVWVDSNQHTVDDIVSALVLLKRFPVMFVFDAFSTADQAEKMEEIALSLEKHNINDSVGIYFRLQNSDTGKKFNELIAKRKYNSQLDKDTQVVGVQSGKIPKFFITNEWRPMSVVSLGVTLRHSKTAVYANCCDLIISHTDTNPIIEQKHPWQ